MIVLYIDENVHGDIVKGLRQREVDVLRVQDDGYSGRLDPDILDRAMALNRVLFSQDEDLLREATLRQRTGIAFVGVIYAHQINVPFGRCVLDLEMLAKVGVSEDFQDTVYYLPL